MVKFGVNTFHGGEMYRKFETKAMQLHQITSRGTQLAEKNIKHQSNKTKTQGKYNPFKIPDRKGMQI